MTGGPQREAWFRQIVESAPSAFIVADAGGCIVFANAEAERMFGAAGEALLGVPVDELVPERYRTAHAGYRNGFLAAAHARPMGAGRDLHARRRDGSEFPVEIGLSPIETPEGRMVLAAIVDVSVRWRLEERFRLAVEAAPSGIVIVDAGGRIALANTQMERMLGYATGELAGQSIEALVPDRLREAHPGYRAAFFARPDSRPMGAGRDLYARRRDGSEIPVEIGLNPLATEEGPLVLAVVVDITARKHAEEIIHASLREKELLLQEVYHRVKNNLQVLGSLLGMQATALGPGPAAAALRESATRVRTMATAHELLYRSDRLGGVEFEPYVRTLAANLLQASDDPAHALRFDLAIEPVSFGIEIAIPLGLIVNELLTNCLKHAYPPGSGGRVRVGLAREPDGRLHLSVRDDGIGLPPGLDPARTNSLGLRLVHALAAQLGGTVEFRGDAGTSASLRFVPGSPSPAIGAVPPGA